MNIVELGLESGLLVLGTLLLAYTVKGASSFGPSLVAVPVLSRVYGHPMAFVPTLALLNLTGNLYLIRRYWTKIDWRIAMILGLGTAMGTPLGILAMKALDTSLLLHLVAFGILAALPLALGYRPQFAVQAPHGILAGALSGFLGGSVGIDGPPYVLFLSRYLHEDTESRYATTLATFTLGCSIRCIGFWSAGLYSPTTFVAYAWALPFMVTGLQIGNALFARMDRKQFDRVVGVLLFCTALTLFMK